MILPVAFVGAVVALGLYELAPDALNTLTREDGVVEYLTTLLYLAAAAILAVAFARRREGRLWLALLALGYFLIAGEEISWGQRLLGVSTPEGLDDANVQGELNLHNLEGLQDKVRLLGVGLFVGLYVAIPVAIRLSDPARRLAARLRLPVAPLWITGLVAIGLLFMVLSRASGGTAIFQLDEVGEIYFGVAAVAFAATARALLSRPAGLSAPP